MIIPKNALIVDKETGVVIGEVGEGDKVFTARAIRAMKKSAQKHAYKPNGWQSVYIKALTQAVSLLGKGAEQDVFFMLIDNLKRNSNRSAYKNGIPLSYKTIAERTGYNEVTVRRVLAKLKKLGIIVKLKGAFIINPYIVWSGNSLERITTNYFKDTIFANEILPKKPP